MPKTRDTDRHATPLWYQFFFPHSHKTFQLIFLTSIMHIVTCMNLSLLSITNYINNFWQLFMTWQSLRLNAYYSSHSWKTHKHCHMNLLTQGLHPETPVWSLYFRVRNSALGPPPDRHRLTLTMVLVTTYFLYFSICYYEWHTLQRCSPKSRDIVQTQKCKLKLSYLLFIP